MGNFGIVLAARSAVGLLFLTGSLAESGGSSSSAATLRGCCLVRMGEQLGTPFSDRGPRVASTGLVTVGTLGLVCFAPTAYGLWGHSSIRSDRFAPVGIAVGGAVLLAAGITWKLILRHQRLREGAKPAATPLPDRPLRPLVP